MRHSSIVKLVVCIGMLTMSGMAAESVHIQVDVSRSYQRLEGFGQAGANSLVDPSGHKTLSDSLRTAAVEAAYRDAGITMGSVGTLLESPGGWDERRNDNTDPLTINWKGFSATQLSATRRHVIDLAKPLGFTNYLLGAEAPNVRWASPWLAAIRNEDYSRFLDEAAEQVLANVTYWKNIYGEEWPYYQLGNEQLSGNHGSINPDMSGYGSVDPTQQMIDLAKRAGARLREAGFAKTRFIVGSEETEEASYQLAAAILADTEARPYVGAIGYHTYPYSSGYSSISFILSTSGAGTPDASRIAIRNKIRDLAQQYNVAAWITENSNAGDPLSYDDFRARAIHIHDEFLYANASASFCMYSMCLDGPPGVYAGQHYQVSNLSAGDECYIHRGKDGRRACGAARPGVSVASYATPLAADSMAVLMVPGLAIDPATGAPPYPATLGGINVTVQDSAGNVGQGPLFYVSANRINFGIPAGMVPGPASFSVNGAAGLLASASQPSCPLLRACSRPTPTERV
jgi:hypothetical protein